jgi:hypothetical protein
VDGRKVHIKTGVGVGRTLAILSFHLM